LDSDSSIFSEDESNLPIGPSAEIGRMGRNNIVSTLAQHEHTDESTYDSYWRFGKLSIVLLLWWLGFSYLFYKFQTNWTFFEAVYYSFITMTGIGYGDFRLNNPIAIEVWWVFLFHAVYF
jgi:hypothetical protein